MYVFQGRELCNFLIAEKTNECQIDNKFKNFTFPLKSILKIFMPSLIKLIKLDKLYITSTGREPAEKIFEAIEKSYINYIYVYPSDLHE